MTPFWTLPHRYKLHSLLSVVANEGEIVGAAGEEKVRKMSFFYSLGCVAFGRQTNSQKTEFKVYVCYLIILSPNMFNQKEK